MNQIARFFATGAYIGYLPRAPGTFGSLEGVLIVLALRGKGLEVYYGVLIGLVAVGMWASGRAEKDYGVKDDQRIVIDEVAGLLLTMLLFPVTMKTLFFGFALFRAYDILKPVPHLEKLPGGAGIMADDLLAGLLANVTLRVILLIL
jgi:phosphatidylglycerophosphatase A